jgi:hypothetical protein
MKVQMNQIRYAVKSTVPQEMWGEIIEQLDEPDQHPEALDASTDSFDDDDDDDPTTHWSSSTTTSFGLRCARRHRGHWGTAAGVDGAFAVAWTMSGVAYR